MGEIEDEAYSEVCEENEGLKGEIGAMAKLAVLLKVDIAEKDAEIERLRYLAEERLDRLKMEMQTTRLLKALLARAADALEFWMKDLASTEQQYVDAAMRDERLLSELRKAAE